MRSRVSTTITPRAYIECLGSIRLDPSFASYPSTRSMARRRQPKQAPAVIRDADSDDETVAEPKLSTPSKQVQIDSPGGQEPRLLRLDEIPDWYGDNKYILSGYRPLTASVRSCLQSWFHLHNQSVNIFTHLFPGLFALILNATLAYGFERLYPHATFWDRAVFHVYLTACALCFGTSAAYHTLLCHSREQADLWVRLDYVSISVLILGSFVPGLYMGFLCEPGLLRCYLTMVD